MRRRHWSRAASRHLDAIRDYIARDNPAAADRVIGKIARATERLEYMPHLARRGSVAGTRELVVSGLPYVVVYTVTDATVEIHGVFHTSRDPALRRIGPDTTEADKKT